MSVFVADTGQFAGDAGSDIATIAAGGFLVIARITATGPAVQEWYGKNMRFRINGSDQIDLTVSRATTPLFATATLTNFATYAPGRWVAVGGRWNTAGAAGDQQIFMAPLTGAFAEASATGQQLGTGAQADDSASAIALMNNTAGGRDVTSPTFAIALFKTYPSLMDFYTVRDRLLETNARPVLPSHVARAWRFTQGTGGVRDLVTNAVATPSSTILTAQDPPRRYPVRVASWDVLPAAAGGGRGIRFDRRRRFIASEG